MKLFLWGTGDVAKRTMKSCLNIVNYNVLGFIDNDLEKQSKSFFGYPIYNPNILEKIIPDKIIILNDNYEAIYKQIEEMFPTLVERVDNKNFFYKTAILQRYENSADNEILEVTDYIKENNLEVFNYPFVNNYKKLEIDVCWDEINKLFFIIHKGHKLYFARRYNTEEKVINYYKSILIEQDKSSPHCYFSDDFCVEDGNVVVDVGVAEGNFSLDIVNKASKIYMIEADDEWIEALNLTFREFMDKIKIIKAFAYSYTDGMLCMLDDLIPSPVQFIKMDIEGNEWDALQGSKRLIENSPNIKFAVCAYHSDFDQILVEHFFDESNFKYNAVPGYMWYPFTNRQAVVSTRLCKGIIRAQKSANSNNC